MTIKVRWKPLVIFLLFCLVAYGGYYYWDTYIKIVPETLLQRTLDKLAALKSYRYAVDLRLFAEGHERYISDIEGERAGDGSFYLKGVIQGTNIEAYHINGTTYLKSGDQDKWMTIAGNEVFDQELFMVEINPLASFHFTEIGEFSYHGKRKIDQQKLHILSLRPKLDHPFMVKHWQDFEYTLYVKKNGDLVKGVITAALKSKPSDTMHMVVEIRDYNARIELVPPVQ